MFFSLHLSIKCIHIHATSIPDSFLCSVVCHSVNKIHIICPSYYWWAFELFSVLRSYKTAINVPIHGFCGHNHSFPLGIFVGIELLGHRVYILWNIISKMVLLICIPTSNIRGFQLFCVLENTWYFQSSI